MSVVGFKIPRLFETSCFVSAVCYTTFARIDFTGILDILSSICEKSHSLTAVLVCSRKISRNPRGISCVNEWESLNSRRNRCRVFTKTAVGRFNFVSSTIRRNVQTPARRRVVDSSGGNPGGEARVDDADREEERKIEGQNERAEGERDGTGG